jgi:UDP-N-acetylmuramoylalanine--D-glutamate ligase
MVGQHFYAIVGLGITGFSCAHYLTRKKIPFAVMDTREKPSQLKEFQAVYPDVMVSLGGLDDNLLDKATDILVSPGIPLQSQSLQRQMKLGKPVIGDIEFFAREVKSPVIAITGTNAKSTVTTLLGEMAVSAGLRVKVGGNLGVPALDLLESTNTDLYVLELSSFQLETLTSLKPTVATVLNITPDHMDRYADFADYIKAKHRIYQHCQVAVCNRDDPQTDCLGEAAKKISFTLKKPGANEFGLLNKEGHVYLAYFDQPLLSVAELPVHGKHYQANALAALAIGYSYGLPMDAMLKTLKSFKGLPHRCELVRERNGVYWYNDSKGTNVGATLAAIEGLGDDIKGKLIIIAGGRGKNADFSPLLAPIEKYAKSVVLIGEAAPLLAKMIDNRVRVQFAQSMEEAVALADKVAASGDSVLLSPACASFDMFKNFEHRGQVFAEVVQAL